jgi:hypothetical protein
MTSTTVTMTLDNYLPTLDLGAIRIREALKVVELLQSISNLMNSAIRSEQPIAVQRYLDSWQALFNEATFHIADIVVGMRPDDEMEQRALNWLLLHVRLNCAEGLMDLVGPGAPEYDDVYSRLLMGRASA